MAKTINGTVKDFPDIALSKARIIKKSQAERIIDRFGGAPRLTTILKAMGVEIDRSTVYRWMYPKNAYGTGGLIPNKYWPLIIRAARLDGVVLSDSDFDPRDK